MNIMYFTTDIFVLRAARVFAPLSKRARSALQSLADSAKICDDDQNLLYPEARRFRIDDSESEFLMLSNVDRFDSQDDSVQSQ